MTWRQVHAVAAGVLLAALLALAPGALGRELAYGSLSPWWWDAVMAGAYLLCGAGLAHRVRHRADPRLWAGMLAVTTAVGLASFPVVADDSVAGGVPWVAMLVPTAAGALGVVVGWVSALVCSVGLACLQLVAQTSQGWPTSEHQRSADFVFLIVCTVSVAAAMEALRSRAHAVEAAEERTVAAATRTSQLAAEEREAARWDALVHDQVLATLSAARSRQIPTDEVRQMARAAIGAFTRAPQVGGVLATALREGLARLTQTAGDGSTLDVVVEDETVRLPGDVADALETAAAEACRNALRHSHGSTRVTISGLLAAEHVTLTIGDDGPGFHPQRISAGRMGIAVSIVGQMRAVGGDAWVHSRVGHGTVVTLRWPAVGT